jgi:hypothetical protein
VTHGAKADQWFFDDMVDFLEFSPDEPWIILLRLDLDLWCDWEWVE